MMCYLPDHHTLSGFSLSKQVEAKGSVWIDKQKTEWSGQASVDQAKSENSVQNAFMPIPCALN